MCIQIQIHVYKMQITCALKTTISTCNTKCVLKILLVHAVHSIGITCTY